MDLFWSLPRTNVPGLDAELGDLFANAQRRRHESGTILSDPGAAPERAFICTSGTLKVSKILSNGREILITILDSGSIWSDRAMLRGYWREVFVEAMNPCETLSIEKELFERFVTERPETFTHFMTRIGEQVSDALTLIDDFRGRDVASRLARVLVRFSKQHGVSKDDTVLIDLPFTHQDLANMIGTARETVTRNMARFRAEGYVRDGQSSTLEILSLNSLEAMIG